MNSTGVERLASIAKKGCRRIIGLMSGTSLDGLDIALCTVEGAGFETKLTVDHFVTEPYDQEFRDAVLACFARRDVDLEHLTLLNTHIAETQARMINSIMKQLGVTPNQVDLLSSHGQTIYHAPRSLHGRVDRGNATLQLGDGDHISVCTGIITCSDFRQKHIAAGGEGAPLAAYGDALLFSHAEKARILINIGGIANFTYLPSFRTTAPAFSSDVGPGNTMMDALVRRACPPLTYDKDAALASRGSVEPRLLAALLDDPFLKLDLPKTTGPEHFSLALLDHHMATLGISMSTEDQLATLNRFSAEALARAITPHLTQEPTDIYLSGGGLHNPLLVRTLSDLLGLRGIPSTNQLGIDPDAKEAVLFAVLANELVAGSPETLRGRIANNPATRMGKISLPD